MLFPLQNDMSNFECMHHPAKLVEVLYIPQFLVTLSETDSSINSVFFFFKPENQNKSWQISSSESHLFPLPPLTYFTWLPQEALLTCQQSAKLGWVHLELLESVSAQVSFKWNTN